MDALPNDFFIQIGEMISATKANTDAIEKLVNVTGELVAAHREISVGYRDLATAQARTAAELQEVRNALALDTESRKDFTFLRRLRETDSERRPMIRNIAVAVASAALIGVLCWVLGALYAKAAADMRSVATVSNK